MREKSVNMSWSLLSKSKLLAVTKPMRFSKPHRFVTGTTALILLIFLTNCRQKPALQQQEITALPADFVAFYEKFHADSAYQMAHIQFPLEGYPQAPDSATLAANFHRTADKWLMHRSTMFVDSLYTRQFDVPMEGLVNEIIMQRNVPYGTYRRFFKRSDGWFLIFYSDMNRIEKRQ